jgi:hypothetical protein
MLHLTAHGGHCCGIKHIHGFGTSPSYSEPEIKAPSVQTSGQPYRFDLLKNKYGDKLADSIPEETKIERLDRILKYITDNWRKGIVEVVLTNGQAGVWEESLFERGFKKVTSCRNSNSANIINVYHLCTDVIASSLIV